MFSLRRCSASSRMAISLSHPFRHIPHGGENRRLPFKLNHAVVALDPEGFPVFHDTLRFEPFVVRVIESRTLKNRSSVRMKLSEANSAGVFPIRFLASLKPKHGDERTIHKKESPLLKERHTICDLFCEDNGISLRSPSGTFLPA